MAKYNRVMTWKGKARLGAHSASCGSCADSPGGAFGITFYAADDVAFAHAHWELSQAADWLRGGLAELRDAYHAAGLPLPDWLPDLH